MKHEWVKKMVAKDEEDVAKLIESMPEDIFNLIELKVSVYKLFSDDKNVSRMTIQEFMKNKVICLKVKGAKKCLGGLDSKGRVNTTVRFYYTNCPDKDGKYPSFCEKCTKADLLIQLLRTIK